MPHATVSARLTAVLALAAAATVSPLASIPAAAAPIAPLRQAIGPAFEQGELAQQAAKPQLLYVSDNFNNQVVVFNLLSKNPTKPARTITAGLTGPQGITTDRAGNLYVTNLYANTVTVYPPGASTPSVTLSQGLSSPVDVKVDGARNVFVANSPGFGQPSYIVEYPAGSSTPSYTWSTPAGGMTISGFALLNASQPKMTSIYAAYYTLSGSGFASGGLLSCYPGNATCVSLGYAFGQTGGVAVEQSPGGATPFQFEVVDQYVPGVDEFEPTQNQHSQLITGGTPWFIAFNAKRTELFVADSFYGRVTEYAVAGGKVLNQFPVPGRGQNPFVVGVAVSPAATYF
jgi:hypothetical protein